jgi:antitoxin VapB
MTETTVFQSGNSQAVRLPKEFRFTSKTVEIFRRGNEIVLREKPRTLGEVLASLPPIDEEGAAEIDAMMAAIKEPLPPDTRDWDALWGPHARPPKAAVEAAPARPGKSTRTAGKTRPKSK